MTKSTVTTERLKQIASGNAFTCTQDDESVAMAAELLAVREAQSVPVGFRSRFGEHGTWHFNGWRDPDAAEKEHCQIEMLYTAPPAPAAPAEVISAARKIITNFAEAESERGRPFRDEVDNPATGVSEENHVMVSIPDLRKLAAALQAGNSPVIPDGWIDCSERMPADDTTVMVVSESGLVWLAEVAGGAFYPDEFPVVKVNSADITHWQPLAAAPTPTKAVNDGND